MEFNKNLFVVVIAFTVTVSFCFVSVASQEVEDESTFSYEIDARDGPEHWGEINKNWEKCKKGQMQSPIDLTKQNIKVSSSTGNLARQYKPAPATMINRGHDIMLKWKDGGAGGIWINGTMFAIKQLHWHSPSEHVITGRRFEFELHMVHVSEDGQIAVIGILYKIGKPDPFLAELEDYIRILKNLKDGVEEVGKIDPGHVQLQRGSRKYYRYIGSLTVPPCTEGVVWTVLHKVRTVSVEQIKLIREAVHDKSGTNARPAQPILQRTIDFFSPEKYNPKA